jgi:hypothetical protein
LAADLKTESMSRLLFEATIDDIDLPKFTCGKTMKNFDTVRYSAPATQVTSTVGILKHAPIWLTGLANWAGGLFWHEEA